MWNSNGEYPEPEVAWWLRLNARKLLSDTYANLVFVAISLCMLNTWKFGLEASEMYEENAHLQFVAYSWIKKVQI